jgi:hypothetical protein
LIVSRHRVAVVAPLARPAESAKDIVGLYWSVERAARRVVPAPLLCEDRHARVDDLNDVIAANRERIVGWITLRRGTLRSYETDPKSVEARHDFRG